MSGGVFISSMLSNMEIGMKQGTRTKFFGREWDPATFEIPFSPDEVHKSAIRNIQGYAAQRENMPEAAAVFDEKRFKKTHDLFAIGGFYAVTGKLAEVLSRFDLGEGGLIPFPIYKADLVTPYGGEFYLLNFGARKNTVIPEASRNVEKFSVVKATGQQRWEVHGWADDGDVALSSDALQGPDLWFEEAVYNNIFLSDDLARALQEGGLAEDWRLKQCRIVEAGR